MKNFLKWLCCVTPGLKELDRCQRKRVWVELGKQHRWLVLFGLTAVSAAASLPASLTFWIYRRNGGDDFVPLVYAVFFWMVVMQWLYRRFVICPRIELIVGELAGERKSPVIS